MIKNNNACDYFNVLCSITTASANKREANTKKKKIGKATVIQQKVILCAYLLNYNPICLNHCISKTHKVVYSNTNY